jgi:hypothetical protein
MKDEPAGSPPLDPKLVVAESSADDKKPAHVQPTAPPAKTETPAAAADDTTDPATDRAVDDIVAKDSDALLAAEDQKLVTASPEKKLGFKAKLNDLLVRWWHNKLVRNLSLAGLGGLVVLLLAFPASRYFILNNLGVRASASLTVLDDSTSLPLKNVQVTLGNQTGLSDDNGNVSLHHIKLGKSPLLISKRAFATQNRSYVVGWGSNPLDSVSLTPVGTQYAFTVDDFLSNKPIAKAQAESGDANAQSDDKGKILLTVDRADADKLSVTIKAKGYRAETLTINSDDANDHVVKLVAARKEVFVSKRSGKYDIYTIDLDGKNEKRLLAGTGNEREGMTLVPHPTDEVAAFVSTRDNVRNGDGFLLSSLLLIDLSSGQITKIGQSERIQVVDWVGSRLVYVQIAAGASAANPRRERLLAYDYKRGTSTELEATNYFNDVLVAGGSVFFAPSSAYQGSSSRGLFRVNPDGSKRTRLLSQEVWNMFRTSYNDLSLAVGRQWFTYKLDDGSVVRASGAPPILRTRIYVDNPLDKNSLWIDNRDGKGVLLLYDLATKKERTLRAQSSLQYPARWVNATTVIYRIRTDQETADYALSTLGGEPLKLSDVTNTTGVSSWYYY